MRLAAHGDWAGGGAVVRASGARSVAPCGAGAHTHRPVWATQPARSAAAWQGAPAGWCMRHSAWASGPGPAARPSVANCCAKAGSSMGSASSCMARGGAGPQLASIHALAGRCRLPTGAAAAFWCHPWEPQLAPQNAPLAGRRRGSNRRGSGTLPPPRHLPGCSGAARRAQSADWHWRTSSPWRPASWLRPGTAAATGTWEERGGGMACCRLPLTEGPGRLRGPPHASGLVAGAAPPMPPHRRRPPSQPVGDTPPAPAAPEGQHRHVAVKDEPHGAAADRGQHARGGAGRRAAARRVDGMKEAQPQQALQQVDGCHRPE